MAEARLHRRLRLLSWNILAGGGSRCGAILKVLGRYDADVIALQETMPARATDICHALGRAGYTCRFSTPRLHNRGQCVLSRVPLARVTGPRPPQARFYPRGWLELEMIDTGLRLAAVYGPPAGPAIPTFWRIAAAWLTRRTTR